MLIAVKVSLVEAWTLSHQTNKHKYYLCKIKMHEKLVNLKRIAPLVVSFFAQMNKFSKHLSLTLVIFVFVGLMIQISKPQLKLP